MSTDLQNLAKEGPVGDASRASTSEAPHADSAHPAQPATAADVSKTGPRTRARPKKAISASLPETMYFTPLVGCAGVWIPPI